MMNESSTSKAALRARLREALKTMSETERSEGSARARELLGAQDLWRAAGAILFYAPVAGEVNLLPLLDEALACGKTVALPGFVPSEGTYRAFEVSHSSRDCAPGKFGIAEPAAHCREMPPKRLDLALVPGLGFDVSGRRLGRGRGFYDRLLAGITGAKCGVAFDQQIVGHVPAEDHDVTMNCLLTPTRWLAISPSGAVSS